MAGYGQYPQYPHGYNPYYNVSPTSQPGVSPDGYMPNPQLLQSSSSDSLHAAYAVYDDGSQPILPAQAGQMRIRRRPVPNAEHVKHRRTRSGCYTCRSRRVKCDEAHPICERCRKGNRECVYPEPTQAGKSSRGGKGKSSTTGEASSDEEDDEQEGKEKLATILDEGEDGSEDPQSAIQETLSPASHTNSQRDGSSPPSLTADKSPSPATEIPVLSPPKRPVITKRQSRQTLKSAAEAKPPEITPEIQFYLDYFRQNITHHHYAQKYDAQNFFTTEYLDIAVTNAPLLYAVVGFSAYHHTLQKPGGRLADFLGFYHMSIKCLRQSIERKQKHNVATLLAILQLANIEEVLGDWVNLMGHQRAAYEILTMLYTPQSIQKSNKLRRAFQWYMHFELFVALQSGYETVLGPEWSQEAYRYCVTQTQNRPDDISAMYEERFACTQAIANEVAVLIARKTKGQITDEAFGAALAGLSQKIASYTTELDQRLIDPAYLVKDFSGAPPRDPDDIVDPYDENTLFGGDRWATNLIFIDIWSVELMFKSMMSAMMQQPPSEDLYQTAIKSAQLFEALELYPRAPPGTIIDAQASFGLATLFLPKDERTKTWCRRKFAKIETLGYIYPKGFRARMTQTWAVDVNFWWLPEEEGCPPIVRELRDFTDERSSMAKDQTSEDLRVLKNIFETMRMADTTTSRSKAPAYAYEGGSPEFVFGSEGSGEAILYEDSPPFKWDYGHDNTPR